MAKSKMPMMGMNDMMGMMQGSSSMAGKSMRKGGGGRFQKRVAQLEAKGYSPAGAAGEAANEGRAKYGKKGMTKMAVAGKRRAARARAK